MSPTHLPARSCQWPLESLKRVSSRADKGSVWLTGWQQETTQLYNIDVRIILFISDIITITLMSLSNTIGCNEDFKIPYSSFWEQASRAPASTWLQLGSWHCLIVAANQARPSGHVTWLGSLLSLSGSVSSAKPHWRVTPGSECYGRPAIRARCNIAGTGAPELRRRPEPITARQRGVRTLC